MDLFGNVKNFWDICLAKRAVAPAKTRQISLPEVYSLDVKNKNVFLNSYHSSPFCIYRGLGLSLFQVAALVKFEL